MSCGSPQGLCAFEDARESIVIPRRNGVRLVIMTARAADTQAHDAMADDANLVRHDIHLEVVIHRFCRFRTDGEESGRDELLVPLRLRIR